MSAQDNTTDEKFELEGLPQAPPKSLSPMTARRKASYAPTLSMVFRGALAVGLVSSLVVFRNALPDDILRLLIATSAAGGILAVFLLVFGLLRFSFTEKNAHPDAVLPQSEAEGSFALLSECFDTLSDAVLVQDRDGQVVYCNKLYQNAASDSPKQGRAASGLGRIFSNDAAAQKALFRLTQAVQRGERGQENIRLNDALFGETSYGGHWYRLSAAPVQVRGRPCSLWQITDITADHREQESQFYTLKAAVDHLDQAPVGFFALDADEKIDYINATLAGWLGIDLASELDGLSLAKMLPEEGLAHFRALVPSEEQLAAQMFETELLAPNSEGGRFPVRLLQTATLCPPQNRRLDRTVVLDRRRGSDISESLRLAEVRFNRFFNNMPFAVVTLDGNGMIVRQNARFLHLFAEARGKTGNVSQNAPLLRLLHEKDRERYKQALETALAVSGQVVSLDGVSSLEDDSRSFQLFFNPVEEHEGETLIVCVLETTHQKALELQFVQSQKMQAVGQLAGGVAHDFNNVLTAIIGASDLLLATLRPSDASFRDVMNIKQNASRAASLVRQLLAFSRRQTLRPQTLRLAETLSDLRALLDRLLGEKVRFEVTLPPDPWRIRADLTQFEQVIINLAVNARDAMPDGGTLDLRVENLEAGEIKRYSQKFHQLPEEPCVHILMEDTGLGIPEENLEKVFEPFFTTKDVGKGTGLGLSTVYGIVKQSGGYIFVESTPGVGSKFHLFFPPWHEKEEETAVSKITDAGASEPARDLTGNANILIVEDEDTVRSVAARALMSRGYKVFVASNGTEALEIMQEQKGTIDLVVSDVVMPEMDGPTLLGHLRRESPDLKVIFVSGYAEDSFSRNLPDAETFEFLPKPFNLKQLVSLVKTVLSR